MRGPKLVVPHTPCRIVCVPPSQRRVALDVDRLRPAALKEAAIKDVNKHLEVIKNSHHQLEVGGMGNNGNPEPLTISKRSSIKIIIKILIITLINLNM